MSIIYIKPLIVGVTSSPVQQLLIDTDNTIAEVETAGYLSNNAPLSSFNDKQIASVYTTDGGMGTYKVVMDGAIASLEQTGAPGTVETPTVAGNVPKFSDIDGNMEDSGASFSDAAKTKIMMANAAMVVDHLVSAADTTGTGKDSGIATNLVLQTSIAIPDTNANLVPFSVTVGQAALAAGGSVTLYTSSTTKQYRILQLFVNRGGTNFSGGGGDRLLSITDNTTVYSLVPAASLQTLANTFWGAAGLPAPASAAINTSTAAGASLVAKYSGGAADYTAGSVVISGLLQRVA